jgi:DNA polymerase-4
MVDFEKENRPDQGLFGDMREFRKPRRSTQPAPILTAEPRILFIDMNSFYASVEQQENPSFRNKPLIVVTVLAETTSAIAASIEAKKLGVKTGTLVHEARQRIPDLIVLPAHRDLYLTYHARLVKLLRDHFPEVWPMSVDEMACVLTPNQRNILAARQAADAIKASLNKEVGDYMRASIGIAPNVFLAKIAADMQKPDGLTIFDAQYPQVLETLKLTDLPGIGTSMEARLHQAGISNVAGLFSRSAAELRKAWRSILGERWFHMLRGSLEHDYRPDQGSSAKSLGHSHVLAPQFRNIKDALKIAEELATRALGRLRKEDLGARTIQIDISGRFTNSRLTTTLPGHARDEISWLPLIRQLFTDNKTTLPTMPFRVQVRFLRLQPWAQRERSLYDSEIQRREAFSRAVIKIDRKYPGRILKNERQTEDRISFGPPEIPNDG